MPLTPDIRYIKKNNDEYGARLREIPYAPEGLYLKGAPLTDAPMIAVVGTRRATPEGKRLARAIAADLAALGVRIVSGLAMGIDTAVHEGALEGGGVTIAVLAHGLDAVYPAQNINLAARILAQGGTFVSEYAPGTPSLPHQFLARNRIVSGLCTGVVVIEAPEKSGSLATARFAIEQNRDVYVAPGPALHPNYKGSHALLKEGARLVTSFRDVLEDMGMMAPEEASRAASLPVTGDPVERTIIAVLQNGAQGAGVDKLHEISNIGISELNRALALLTIRGMIREERGKYYL